MQQVNISTLLWGSPAPILILRLLDFTKWVRNHCKFEVNVGTWICYLQRALRDNNCWVVPGAISWSDNVNKRIVEKLPHSILYEVCTKLLAGESVLRANDKKFGYELIWPGKLFGGTNRHSSSTINHRQW